MAHCNIMEKKAGLSSSSKELWNNVREWLDQHPGTKVLAGGTSGAILGNILSRFSKKNREEGKHGTGTLVGAILGALSAGADNNHVLNSRLRRDVKNLRDDVVGGQDYLARGQQMQTMSQFFHHPEAAIKEYRQAARRGLNTGSLLN